MSAKTLLADVIREITACQREEEKLQKTSKSADVLQLRRSYCTLSDRALNAVTTLSVLRRQPSNKSDFIQYCNVHMKALMDIAERAQAQEVKILIPNNSVDSVFIRGGLVRKHTLLDRESEAIQQESPFHKVVHVTAGSHLITVCNMDAYAVADPRVELNVHVGDSPIVAGQKIPSGKGYVRVVGTSEPAVIQIDIRTDATRRSSHVSVRVHSLVAPSSLQNNASEWADLPTVRTARTECLTSRPGIARTKELHDPAPLPPPLPPGVTTGTVDLGATFPFVSRQLLCESIASRWPQTTTTAAATGILDDKERLLLNAIMNLPAVRRSC